MPFSDPARRREYVRNWEAKRRAAWFEGKVCEQCGSPDDLELDHRDPSTKITHRIWAWGSERREAELAKCRPLCRDCHRAKTNTEIARGEQIGVAKLTEIKVREIRASNLPGRQLGRLYGVDEKAIRAIRRGTTWKHVV
jgi:5-methylcytosine-specific restriction endonuclease McrA